jgi:hypothetical protein
MCENAPVSARQQGFARMLCCYSLSIWAVLGASVAAAPFFQRALPGTQSLRAYRLHSYKP